jgi:hypothetical protein
MVFPSTSIFVYAQSETKVRNLECQFVNEQDCPVEVTNITGKLELDAFEAPIGTKIYLDYKNSSAKSIMAVKFRVRLVDGQGADKGTFQAVDQVYVASQATRCQKWKREFVIHQGVSNLKVRVLQVKFEDGEVWESFKAKDLNSSGEASGSQAASGSDAGP